ncbi:TetR/AcrR family transcriptional regulator C-terminal domain-containing protein [Saccharothrix variisporea]|uniref:TetR family transcriptional regulator n=1 Tax=Saccharothrix variisporea TaxID=543527 RepID=A0A495XI82_9PSEU|nr:TetR/AcrR family transcriptional regulator C-terminal domain-containing protein [Saccharothrix variisporea]RKT73702.1 TetR family transcriptional regulator [Saccharothrix variisporea]
MVYERIAGEIKQRIARGELRPGDRVPSTREITARWGVAMATATKVLASLREEGLVHAVAGVGTVVSSPTPVNPAVKDDLTADAVVRAALAIADAEGLGALSMRRVAAGLGVAAMSLYRHVPGKDELVLRMIDSVFVASPPPEATGGWRERLEAVARVQWDMFSRHPWLAGAISMTRPTVLPNAVAHTEWIMQALDGHGLSVEEALQTAVTLFGFVRGIAVNLEHEAEQRQHTGITNDEWMDRQSAALASLASSGRFPMFARLLGTEVDMELRTLFEFGLARMLDGIGEWISGRPALDG